MKGRLPTLLLSSLLVISLASCGGGEKKPDESSEQSEQESSETSSDTSSTPSGETTKVEFSFWHTFGKTPWDAIEAAAREFAALVKEQENVEVKINFAYKGSYTDMPGLVTKGFAGGDNPTICVAYPDHVANYFAAEKTPGQYVVNLMDFAKDDEIGFGKEEWLGDEEGIDDFVTSFIEEGMNYKYEGLYSLPYMKSTEVMFYNLNQLRIIAPLYTNNEVTSDAEIEEFMNELSWDDFMDLCEFTLDNSDKLVSTFEVPAFYDSDGNFIISKMYQNNIGYSSLDDEGNGRIDFNGMESDTFTPSAEQTKNYNDLISLVEELRSAYNDGLITTKGAFGTYGSNNFVEQKTIFSVGSSGGAGYQFPDGGDAFKVGICKIPASNNNPLYVSQGPSLCVLNTNKADNDLRVKYAWKFLKYITNAEVNAALCVDGSEGYIPVRQSAYETSKFLGFIKNGDDYSKTAKVVLNEIDGDYFNTAVFPGSAELRKYIGGALTDALLGKKSAKDAIDGAITATIPFM